MKWIFDHFATAKATAHRELCFKAKLLTHTENWPLLVRWHRYDKNKRCYQELKIDSFWGRANFRIYYTCLHQIISTVTSHLNSSQLTCKKKNRCNYIFSPLLPASVYQFVLEEQSQADTLLLILRVQNTISNTIRKNTQICRDAFFFLNKKHTGM